MIYNVKLKSIKLQIIILFFLSFEAYAQSNIYILNIDRYINQYTADYICDNLDILNKNSIGISSKPTSSSSIECVIITLSATGGITDEINRIAHSVHNSVIPVIVYIQAEDEIYFTNTFLIPISSSFTAIHANTVIRPSNELNKYKLLADSSKMNDEINKFLSEIKNYSITNLRSLSCLKESFDNNTPLSAEDANTMKVINALAADQNELISKLNGQYVSSANGGKVLNTLHASINKINMDIRPQFLELLNNPIVGYFILIIAFYSLIWSLFNESKVFSLLSAIILFITAFYVFNSLPLNFIGIALISTAFLFFSIGVKVKSFGLLEVLGTALLFAGSLSVIDFYSSLGVLVIPFYVVAGITIFTFLVFIIAKTF